jgi:hypothetical protein
MIGAKTRIAGKPKVGNKVPSKNGLPWQTPLTPGIDVNLSDPAKTIRRIELSGAATFFEEE